MQYNGGRQKGFIQSFTWVGVMLLAMGAVFLSVALIMQFIPIDPNGVSVLYSHGVGQLSTEETVRTFRLIFLLVFGIAGLCMAIAGAVVATRKGSRRRQAQRLKAEGVRLTAEVAGYTPAVIRMNNYRYLMRLYCNHTGPDGITYIFKSDPLRMDPMPYLHEGKINVYHERDNMKRYFVDVDGSAEIGTRVVEL